jgi:HK97 family phage prohead protease
VNRAYALLNVKSVDADKRVITGTATTPEPDRQGDVIEPLGATFKNPLPLLLYHNSQKPIGQVTFKRPTKDGIDFEAQLPAIDEAGTLKDRIDEAWQSVKAGLISGVSIGFRAIETAFMEGGGLHFLKVEIVELSLVTVPANASATIASIKSLDLAASGLHSPGATGSLPVVRAGKAAPAMTTAEQIASFENKRAAHTARMTEIMTKSDGSTLDDAQREEYTTLEREVDSIDEHLPRLRKLEKTLLLGATPITPATGSAAASEMRGGAAPVRVEVKSVVPKGTAFTRFAMCLAAAKGDSYQAISRAKSYADSTPEVEKMVEATLNWHTKAAVAAGTTTDATWAGPLAVAQPLVNEFLELLRPRTIIGRVPGFRQVPFNVSVPSQTGGGTYSWVGQGNAKPVTSATFATVSVPFSKAAGIIV